MRPVGTSAAPFSSNKTEAMTHASASIFAPAGTTLPFCVDDLTSICPARTISPALTSASPLARVRLFILQLNRDTITTVPMLQADGTAYASADIQLCTAHWYGGDKKASCENTVTTVSKMLGGIPIDGYYALSMDGLETLNQAVGGVTVTFPEDLTEIDPAMKQGETITLTDEQAEKLIRARMEMTDDRNTQRMSRQRIFLDGFLSQVNECQSEDSDFIIELYDSLHPYATADINMNELTKLMKNLGNYTSKGVYTIDGESKVGQRLGDSLDHWEFYMDEGSLDSTMNALYPLVYDGVWEEESEE